MDERTEGGEIRARFSATAAVRQSIKCMCATTNVAAASNVRLRLCIAPLSTKSVGGGGGPRRTLTLFDFDAGKVPHIISRFMDVLARARRRSHPGPRERCMHCVPSFPHLPSFRRKKGHFSQRRSGKRSTWGPLFCRALYMPIFHSPYRRRSIGPLPSCFPHLDFYRRRSRKVNMSPGQ